MISTGNQVCSRCVLDETVPEIEFNADGVCQYCRIHDELAKRHPLGGRGEAQLQAIAAGIKRAGKRKQYDCIVGVSGGRDSTYTLLLAKKLGLRPLAVHFDNGWNSDTAVTNIRNATNRLKVDLHTVVANWEEFKDLQRAFLKASVPDADIPTDYAIYSVLFETAAKEGVRFILEGHSFRTEGTSPRGWTYMDGRYVRSVHRRFGKRTITSFPILRLSTLLYYTFFRRIRYVRPLECMDYRRDDVSRTLEQELGWKYYGGHHHESNYTKFFQSFYLPKKFNIDKRKTELSAMIRSGQTTREDALSILKAQPYEIDEELVEYCMRKLDLTSSEFEAILNLPRKSFKDYPTYYPMIQAFAGPIRLACRLNLLPQILALKYVERKRKPQTPSGVAPADQ